MNTIIKSLGELFDQENPTAWSEAARTLAERRPALQAEIDAAKARWTEKFSAMTKDELVAFAAASGITLKHAIKDAMVQTAVNAFVPGLDAKRELDRLFIDARSDVYVVRRLTQALEEAEAEKTKLVESLMQSPNPGHITNAMAWQSDGVAVAAARAKWAYTVIREVENGTEFRAAVNKIAARAMSAVMNFPSRIASMGAGTSHRMEDIAEAVAAAWFMENVAGRIMGGQVPAEWITR